MAKINTYPNATPAAGDKLLGTDISDTGNDPGGETVNFLVSALDTLLSATTQTLTNKTLTSPAINVTSDATGDTYYRSAGGQFVRLPIGSTGQILKVAGGIPAWAAGSVFSFCQVRNTDTSTNINPATAANIPFGGTTDATDSDYTLASDSITVNFDGVVTVQAHISQSIPQGVPMVRPNVGIWITNNNTKVSGVGQTGYIRNADDHNESSSHMSATFAVSDGDVIRVQGEERAASGTVNQIAGESQVTVERRT